MFTEINLEKLRETKQKFARDRLTFGIDFLNDVTGGIFKNDVIVISAHTGIGKTDLSTIIAQHNALEGRNVYYFALEAFQYEIELRIAFKIAKHSQTSNLTTF